MPVIETESLVLKSYNLAEADRIVVFFTRDHGVVRGVAKGAKRLKSRFGSTLEPFSTVHLSYFQKEERELVSIQGAELVRSYFSRASDPEFFHTFSYISELLLAFAPPQDPNETLYRMINACLGASEEASLDLGPIRLYFEVWLLRLGGYLPDWERCGECRRDLKLMTNVFLAGDFHLICNECRRTRNLPIVSGQERTIFREIQTQTPFAFAQKFTESAELIKRLSAVMGKIVSYVLGKDILVGPFARAAVVAERNAI